jgi:uncharacterized protein (TIGR00369 family)
VSVAGAAGEVCLGLGSFAFLDPTPIVPQIGTRETVDELSYADLDVAERAVFDRARHALEDSTAGAFSERFWGIETRADDAGAISRLVNGIHIANRAGNVQGGIQLGLAMKTAVAALPPDWTTVSLHATFLRSGVGKALRANSGIVHRGGTFAVLDTRIVNDQDRLIFQMTSTHSRRH